MNWFYRSFLGRLYLEFLIIWDNIKPRKKLNLTPTEISQIIREYSLLGEGVKTLKRNIRPLVSGKDPQQSDKVLRELNDLTLQAQNDPNSEKSRTIEALKSRMDFSNKDIKGDTDYAKMLDKRISDYNDLHAHINKRNALREARKQKNGK